MNIWYLLAVLVIILLSMSLHEMSHAYVAYWLGDDTARAQGRLTLNPLKHIDPVMSIAVPLLFALSGGPIFGGAKPVPLNFSRIKGGNVGIALVAIAGPLVNLILAYLAFCVVYYAHVPVDAGWGFYVFLAVQVNLGFFVFNLIPIPPLDGSRVLYALAPQFIQTAMEKMERFGLIIMIALVLVFGSFLTAFMGNAINFIIVDIFGRLVL
ncbi:site-2 protease family protein [Candidatus Saccharibacteria bacterium]|nr:site-2 protease family protein [Candidatus Saccharibacteria bacterium]